MDSMFSYVAKANPNISDWDTSKITKKMTIPGFNRILCRPALY